MGVSIQQPYIAKYYLKVKCFEASTYVKKAGLKVGVAQEHLRYSSRLSLHSRVAHTRVFINFIRAISRRSRVTERE